MIADNAYKSGFFQKAQENYHNYLRYHKDNPVDKQKYIHSLIKTGKYDKCLIFLESQEENFTSLMLAAQCLYAKGKFSKAGRILFICRRLR